MYPSAVKRKLYAWTGIAGITPRDEAAGRDGVDAWKLADSTDGLIVEIDGLRIAALDTRRRRRDVEREHLAACRSRYAPSAA